MTAERDQRRLSAAYWLLMRAYPAGYRRERGAEIVSMLLEGSRPGQRWPTLGEAADLLGGGLRRRSGLWRVVAPASVRVAGAVAFVLAAGLSLFWLTGYELRGEPSWVQEEGPLGPFESSSPVMYAAWLASAAAVSLFGRYGRRLAVLSLAVTWGMFHLADLLSWPRPADDMRTVLLLLGLLALAAPARPTRRQRLAFGSGVLGVAAVAWVGGWWAGHQGEADSVLNEAYVGAGVASAAALLVAVGIGLDRGLRESWRGRVGALALLLPVLALPLAWTGFLFH